MCLDMGLIGGPTWAPVNRTDLAPRQDVGPKSSLRFANVATKKCHWRPELAIRQAKG